MPLLSLKETSRKCWFLIFSWRANRPLSGNQDKGSGWFFEYRVQAGNQGEQASLCKFMKKQNLFNVYGWFLECDFKPECSKLEKILT
jgi:hypothetical protein